MLDLEVEKTLREIRERVRAEVGAGARGGGAALESAARGDGFVAEADGPVADALLRLEANLATADRARSRLPPVMSNRRGWPARLELWVKRQLKRATHWFTWEQVNYNAAVHQALRDAHAAISASDAEVASLQRQLADLRDQLDARDARTRDELAAGLHEVSERAGERTSHVLEEQRVLFRQLSLEASERAVACDRARRDLETRLGEIRKAVMSDE
jgi:hypothetical protein